MFKKKGSWLGALAGALAVLGAMRADAMSQTATDIVGLIEDANAIVVGRVASVNDGIDDRGIPYTEVKIDISESIRGNLSGTYTFRQYGLLKPRPVGEHRIMMPAPEGFPRYTQGEENVLFLRPAAAWTGLRTTSGLGAGKFVVGAGRLENAFANAGLFHDIRIDADVATDADKQMLVSDGAMNPDTFLSFLRRAVSGHWVETGLLSRRPR